MRILYIDVNAYTMCRLMRKFLQVLRVNARLSVNIRGGRGGINFCSICGCGLQYSKCAGARVVAGFSLNQPVCVGTYQQRSALVFQCYNNL